MDCSLPRSSIHGISQARVLELVAFPSPGDFPDPGIEPRSSALQADALSAEPPGVRACLTGGFLRAVSHEPFVPLQAEQHAAPRD